VADAACILSASAFGATLRSISKRMVKKRADKPLININNLWSRGRMPPRDRPAQWNFGERRALPQPAGLWFRVQPGTAKAIVALPGSGRRSRDRFAKAPGRPHGAKLAPATLPQNALRHRNRRRRAGAEGFERLQRWSVAWRDPVEPGRQVCSTRVVPSPMRSAVSRPLR
jgi:hypothetical protein